MSWYVFVDEDGSRRAILKEKMVDYEYYLDEMRQPGFKVPYDINNLPKVQFTSVGKRVYGQPTRKQQTDWIRYCSTYNYMWENSVRVNCPVRNAEVFNMPRPEKLPTTSELEQRQAVILDALLRYGDDED